MKNGWILRAVLSDSVRKGGCKGNFPFQSSATCLSLSIFYYFAERHYGIFTRLTCSQPRSSAATPRKDLGIAKYSLDVTGD